MKRTATAAIAGVALAGLIGVGAAAAANGTGPGEHLAEVLSGLVDKGTISQQQADDVAKALTDARAEQWAEREQERTEHRAETDALLLQTLGMDMDALHERLAQGETLLEIAKEKDAARELADGMVGLLATRLDEAVAEGRITSSQAEETLTAARSRADAWLDGQETGPGAGLGLLLGGGMGRWGVGPQGMGPEGMGPRGGMGHRGGQGYGQGYGQRGWGDDGSTDGSAPTGSTTAALTSWRA